MMYQHILDRLPYKSSFRFVDEITFLDPDKVIGHYTLRPDAFFYEDHFAGYPVTPGAILTEIMAQIGLVVLGIFLVSEEERSVSGSPERSLSGSSEGPAGFAELGAIIFPLLASVEVSFLRMVLPGQKVTVISNKIYFRWGKLKCKVLMQDAAGDEIAKGVFSGMIKPLNK